MEKEKQIALVQRYFTAVDAEKLEDILDLLTPDCVFRVETHDVTLRGAQEISAMFNRLWSNHKAVHHGDFRHVPDPDKGRIACQFKVRNTEHDGGITHKSNCNFFDIAEGRFSRIAVYMAGANTLEGQGS